MPRQQLGAPGRHDALHQAQQRPLREPQREQRRPAVQRGQRRPRHTGVPPGIEQLRQAGALRRRAQQHRQLAQRDGQRGAGLEALQHRHAEQRRQRVEPPTGGQREHHRDFGRQHQCRVVRRNAGRRIAHRLRDHQREHRHRTDPHRAARAEGGVRHQRQQARVQAGLRGEAREQRIGQALRDQQHADHGGGQNVLAQRIARIGSQASHVGPFHAAVGLVNFGS
jgi:hypothetical protein